MSCTSLVCARKEPAVIRWTTQGMHPSPLDLLRPSHSLSLERIPLHGDYGSVYVWDRVLRRLPVRMYLHGMLVIRCVCSLVEEVGCPCYRCTAACVTNTGDGCLLFVIDDAARANKLAIDVPWGLTPAGVRGWHSKKRCFRTGRSHRFGTCWLFSGCMRAQRGGAILTYRHRMLEIRVNATGALGLDRK